MMNKNCTLVESGGLLSIAKTKSGSKVAAFSLDYKLDPSVHKQVSWLYLDSKPSKEDFDSVYSLEEIVSEIDTSKWFWEGSQRPREVLSGEAFIEWRGTVNKWKRLEQEGQFTCEPLTDENASAAIDMVEKWRWLDNGGMKYGWQERAGCDKALIQRYASNYEGIRDYAAGTVFKVNGEVVGYSCIEKKSLSQVDGIPEFKYLTRKVLNTRGHRNLTEYIDYKTIELVHKLNPHLRVLLVNWGASSGGVYWYKTHKFPVYSLETKWFCSKKVK